MDLDIAVELLDRLAALRAASPAHDPQTETLRLLELLGRCAFDTAPGGHDYAKSGLAALSELHEVQRKALLLRLQRLRRPSPGLAAVARDLDFAWDTEGDYLSPPQRAAIGLWLGRDATALGISESPAAALSEDRQPGFARPSASLLDLFMTRAHPERLDDLDAALADLPGYRDEAFTRWCERRPLARHHELDDPELDRFEALDVPFRLRTAVAMMARVSTTRDLAESWIPLVEPDWKTRRDNADRAIADAQLAAVVGQAGDTASAEGLLFHANAGLDRENDPMRRADVFQVLFTATAILANAPLGGPGPGSWLGTLDRLQRDKVVLRQRDALFAARQAAIVTLPRAAQAGGALADRGHEALKDLGRRIPERWLELLHLTTASLVWRQAGRDPETHLSALADLLRRDGLPQTDARVELAALTVSLVEAAPARLAVLGDRLASPVARAIWWSTALLTALP